jgi:hypothetical protein
MSSPGVGMSPTRRYPPCDLDGTWDSSTVPVEPGDGKTYLKAVNETCYQLGLRFLEERAAARGGGADHPAIHAGIPGYLRVVDHPHDTRRLVTLEVL